jgi:hypothetical protein
VRETCGNPVGEKGTHRSQNPVLTTPALALTWSGLGTCQACAQTQHAWHTNFISHGSPLGGRVGSLQGAACDASLLEPPQCPQPRAWAEIHAVAYTDRICWHATPVESSLRTCKPTQTACELRIARAYEHLRRRKLKKAGSSLSPTLAFFCKAPRPVYSKVNRCMNFIKRGWCRVRFCCVPKYTRGIWSVFTST